MTEREGVVTLESGATAALRRGANDLGVVCLHPWGPLGGSRDDPVSYTHLTLPTILLV